MIRPVRKNEFVGGIKDDALDSSLEKLKPQVIEHVRSVAGELLKGMTAENAPRSLYVLEQVISNTRSTLSELTIGGEGARRSRRHPPEYIGSISDMAPPMDTETYGAQAIERVTGALAESQNTPDKKIATLARALSYLEDTEGTEEQREDIKKALDKETKALVAEKIDIPPGPRPAI
jgi:hypothetical protein